MKIEKQEWRIMPEEASVNYIRNTRLGHKYKIANVICEHQLEQTESRAIAKLICASPNLLAACKDALYTGSDPDTLKQIRITLSTAIYNAE